MNWLLILREGNEFSETIDSSQRSRSPKDDFQRPPLWLDIRVMVRVSIQHTEQNFGDDATTKWPETLTTAKSAHSEQLCFTKDVVPKRRSFIQSTRTKKLVLLIGESDLWARKRRHTSGPASFLS